MFIHITPKKVNKMSELTISATFKHQGVEYESRFKTKGHFKNALRRTKDMFVSLVDMNEMKVVRRDDLQSYLNNNKK